MKWTMQKILEETYVRTEKPLKCLLNTKRFLVQLLQVNKQNIWVKRREVIMNHVSIRGARSI